MILSISGLMTARFLLHLRQWDHRVICGASTTENQLGNTEPIGFRHTEVGDEAETFVNQERNNVIEEFGRDPVRQAKRDRRHSPELDEV